MAANIEKSLYTLPDFETIYIIHFGDVFAIVLSLVIINYRE